MTRAVKLLISATLVLSGVLVLLSMVWAHSEVGGDHCDDAFLGGDERTTPSVRPLGWNWWPPGMRCEVSPQGGQPQTKIAPLL